MNGSRAAKRRSAGIASAKVLITSASLAATIGGWAAIGATSDPATGLANTAGGPVPPADAAGRARGQALPGRQQDGGTSPSPQVPFGERRRHRGEWTPNGGNDGQPSSPGAPDLGQVQPPDQSAPITPNTPNANPAPETPDTPDANPAPAPLPQLQPRARTRSSR